MASVDNRVRMRIDSDNRKVIYMIKQRYDIKTDSDAVNHALRIYGINSELEVISETHDLLQSVLNLLHNVPKSIGNIEANLKMNEAISIRTFAFIRRMIQEFDSENKTGWLQAAEEDFKAHMRSKLQGELR